MKSRNDLLNEIDNERTAWHALLAEVGEDRMEEPGPMGDWTFKDFAAHLAFWNERSLARIEAGADGQGGTPWPAAMGTEDTITDWDEVNAWIYAQHRDRPLRDVLDDMDRWFDRLTRLIESTPEDDLMTPGRFAYAGMGDIPLVEAEFFGHFHEEHEPSVRAWLASR